MQVQIYAVEAFWMLESHCNSCAAHMLHEHDQSKYQSFAL